MLSKLWLAVLLFTGMEVLDSVCRCPGSLALYPWWICTSIPWLCEIFISSVWLLYLHWIQFGVPYLWYVIQDPRLLAEIHISLIRTMLRDIEDVGKASAYGGAVNQYTAPSTIGGGHSQLVESVSTISWREILSFNYSYQWLIIFLTHLYFLVFPRR